MSTTTHREPPPAEPPPAAPEKPKRKPPATLPARTVFKHLTELASQRWQPRSSLKLSTGPRGQVMIDLTCHAGDAPGVETLDDLIAYTVPRFDALRAAYGVQRPGESNGGDD